MRRFLASLLQFNPADRIPSFLAIGMLIGAAWYFAVQFEPDLAVLAAGFVLSVLAVWAARRLDCPGAVFAAMLIALGAMTGALAGRIATLRVDAPRLTAPVGPALLEGWITDAEPAKRGVRLVIRVHAIDGLPRHETPTRVRVTQISRLETEPGRFVRCWAVLRPPPPPVIANDYAFDRQAWYSRLGAVGYVQGRCRGGALGAPASQGQKIERQLAQIRRQLAVHVHAHAGPRAGGFAAALASGDRSYMATADQDALRRAGLAHLLAISGLHMGIVGGLVFLIVWRGLALIEPLALRLSVRKPAAAAALLACACYLFISGASVSTQRAFVMALILFGAVLIDRVALTQRSLAIAMIVVILMAPWSVLTPGFQMSFAATAAPIAAYESWRRQRLAPADSRGGRIVFWGKSLVVTSIVSSLATMPFALYHFDRVAGLGILANLAAMPIISLISAPLAGAALILAPFGLDHWALRGFGWSLEGVLSVAHAFADRPASELIRMPPMPGLSLTMFAAALAIVCVLRGAFRRNVASVGLIAMALLAWANAGRPQIHWAPSGDVFLVQANGHVDRLALRAGPGLAPLRYAQTPRRTICATGELCQIVFRHQTIVYVPENREIDCGAIASADLILLGAASPPCPSAAETPTVSWQSVRQENGVTLEWRRGGFRVRSKMRCGVRPWRPCTTPRD